MKGVVGMFERPNTGPKLRREDSALKKSMKRVMELKKRNKPSLPKQKRD